jgi:hypothetical protein
MEKKQIFRTPDFSNAKVGDEVFCLARLEWLKISSIGQHYDFPILLENDEKYTFKGYYNINDSSPLILDYDPQEEMSQASTERVVLVRDYEGQGWQPRVLIKVIEGDAFPYVCWEDVKTIEEAKRVKHLTAWAQMKELPNNIEVTIDELISTYCKENNLSPEQIKIKEDEQ